MKRLAAIAFALSAVAASSQPASALSCVREWGSDTFAGAQQAVAHPERADALMVGTVAAVERQDDYWRTRVLVVEPRVVFIGDLRNTARIAIGGHGPDMSFTEGATYFLALARSVDTEATEWFVNPCAPNMELTSGDQLTQLRAISDSEVVIAEPVISRAPNVLWIVLLAGLAAIAWMWLARRRRSPIRS